MTTPGAPKRLILCLLLAGLASLPALPHAGRAQAPTPVPTVIFQPGPPFLFAFGTWDKRARVEGGLVRLDTEGLTPKGGAGVNIPAMDLSADAAACPGLRVKVGPRSTLQALKLLLRDAGGHSGTWAFRLPPPAAGFAVVIPADGAPLSRPDDPGGPEPLDLCHIVQWQMLGDWGGDGPVDVQVSGVLAVAADDAIRQKRRARAQQEAAVREQARRDRDTQRTRYGRVTAFSPVLQAVYAAAPDVLALVIHSGTITPARLSSYAPRPGDGRTTHDNAVFLVRGGREVGHLIGPKKDALVTPEGFSGDPLLTAEADDPASYAVRSPDDPAYARALPPLSVARKSKPDDWQQIKQAGVTVRHVVYLRLPRPLTPGRTYAVTLTGVNVRTPKVTLAFDPARVWSESVHVSQVGFRPDDPRKRAFLSLWLGTGGAYGFPDGLTFRLIDDATGRAVYTGHAGGGWSADTPETMQTTRNFNGTTVFPLDFTEFHKPGRYRVSVDGVGCSYPFPIGRDVWQAAFRVQMQGFYSQRSGVALGPPDTPFVRPRDFHPGDPGVSVTQSTYSILDGGDPQKGLAKGDTGVPVPGAWGGYHDAGDWNPRRGTHMRTTTFWQLELLELFPDYFGPPTANIAHTPSGPGLLDECRFELDLFRRLQKPDGGVPFGIETNGDPVDGEVSWKQSMPAYVYAPDVQSSYVYAGVAARASRLLARRDPPAAKGYRESALRAIAWAEADREKRQRAGTWAGLGTDVTEDRTLAALEVYALTRDRHWHAVFLEGTALNSAAALPFFGSLPRRDTAFLYARLPDALADPSLKENAVRALVADADGALAYQSRNAWGIASDDPGRPQFLGFYSTPHGAVSLLRAYTLTQDRKYLAGAVQATLFPGGANPGNLVYTSGVGANPVRHPLNLDSRWTGQPAPAGITVYGNVDLSRWGDQAWITWPLTYFLGASTQPPPTDWPTTEAYFDVFFMPAENELTMDQTMGPNAYVWGYLAARR